ncbi:uncharacterized protein LOC141910735 isoform X2 [Tubulanus polymorphus]
MNKFLVVAVLIYSVQASVEVPYRFDDYDQEILREAYPKYMDFITKATDGCVTFKEIDDKDVFHIGIVHGEVCFGLNKGHYNTIGFNTFCNVGRNIYALLKYGVRVEGLPDYWKDRDLLMQGILSSNEWSIPAEYMSLLKQQYC